MPVATEVTSRPAGITPQSEGASSPSQPRSDGDGRRGAFSGKFVVGIQRRASLQGQGLTIAEPSRLTRFWWKTKCFPQIGERKKKKKRLTCLFPRPPSPPRFFFFFFSFNFSLSSLITSPRTRGALPGPRRGAPGAAGPQVRGCGRGEGGAARSGGEAAGERPPARSAELSFHLCFILTACNLGLGFFLTCINAA